MDTVEFVKVGKYEFKISESIKSYNDRIISHTFKIGGIYDNCIGVSYTYNYMNKPISAKIPHALYEPECSTGSNLEKGEGTIIMLKSLLNYVYNKIPSVNNFIFDDMSHIDCVEKDMSKKPPRSPTKPLNLAYFSIAYHGKTWYEKNFNAKMKDINKYNKYRERLEFLTDPSKKVDYIDFLRIARPNSELFPYLEKIYNNSKTYRDFFEAIPKSKRCDILYSWLVTFMEYYLRDVYSNYDWVIDVNTMNNISGGSKKKSYSGKYKLISHKRMDMF
jgi:hypothetical protein